MYKVIHASNYIWKHNLSQSALLISQLFHCSSSVFTRFDPPARSASDAEARIVAPPLSTSVGKTFNERRWNIQPVMPQVKGQNFLAMQSLSRWDFQEGWNDVPVHEGLLRGNGLGRALRCCAPCAVLSVRCSVGVIWYGGRGLVHCGVWFRNNALVKCGWGWSAVAGYK